MVRLSFLLTLILLTVVSCTTSPLGRKQLTLFPNSTLEQMGVTAYAQIKQETPRLKNAQVVDYVSCVASTITRAVDGGAGKWEITVFDRDEANAFALPGGKIGVYSGLLKVAENQDQLATVIGHEVAHVLAEHANERVSTAYATQAGLDLVGAIAGSASSTKNQLLGLLGVGAQIGILLPFSREQETEADLLGIELMAKGGFDPRQSVPLWQNMIREGGRRPPEFLSTHPAGETRIQRLNGHIPKAMPLYERAVQTKGRPNCGP